MNAKEMKHTPGKSEIRKDGNVFDLVDETGAHTTTDTIKRARLYAVAPDLLAACKMVLEHQKQKINIVDYESYTALNKAIAAAESE